MQWQRTFSRLNTPYHPLSGNRWYIDVRGVPEWKAFLQAQADAMNPDSKFMGEIAQINIQWIKKRVLSGQDFKEQPMAAYTKKYADFKRRLGLGPTVNMHLFGNLYKNLTYKIMPRPGGILIRLFFSGDINDIIAYVHQVGGVSGPRNSRFNQKSRKHFGLTEKNYDDDQKLIYDAIANWLSGCWNEK